MNGRFDKIAPGLVAKLNFLFDETFAIVALLITATTQHQSPDERLGGLSILVLCTWFLAAGLLRLYSPWTPRTKADSAILHFIAAAAVATAVTLAQAITTGSTQHPVPPIIFGVVFAAGTVSVRLLFLTVIARIEAPLDKVLIVGTGPHAVAAYQRLTSGTGGAERRGVVGFLRMRGQPDRLDDIEARVLGDVEDLMAVLATHPVAEVYLAAPVLAYGAQIQSVIRICEEIGMPFALPLHLMRFERAKLLYRLPDNDGFLHYHAGKVSPSRYAMKRLIDIVASALALVVLSPLLIGVTIAIKATSKGPVLFKQQRVGLHGASFNLFKFRSMVQNAEALRETLLEKNEQTGPVFKIKNDPRITAVGRFIRRYSIDELPQLINILRGDMTIVGPRPAIPSEVSQYKVWQRRRLSVRPGLTCLWQVGGRNSIGFEEWMRLDLQYVDNWSLALDLRLILQTVPVVIAGKGAS